MTTPLQQAAQAMIDRWESPDWKDTPHTAHYVAELRKALDAELAQSVVPEGYVLVPVEPTDEELAKGVRAMSLFVTKNSLIDFSLGYKAMLTAAQGEKP